jgi:uncharacterized protein (TIGR02466 family)
MFAPPFYQTSLDYDHRDSLIQSIVSEYEKTPMRKPSSWEENVHTSIQYGDYKNNIEYFEKAGIPLDLVARINQVVQEFIFKLGISDIGTFYIAEMWYNAYANSQFQHMHKHSNNNNMLFSGVYYMKFNEKEHSATRFYNPYFEIDFNKVRNNSFFVKTPIIKENDIIIFPSEVGHDVLEQNTSDLRITIAFNVACLFNETQEARRFTYG